MRIEYKEHNNLHEYIKTLSAIKHHRQTLILSPCQPCSATTDFIPYYMYTYNSASVFQRRY